MPRQNRYGLFNSLFDIIVVALIVGIAGTCGIWLLWIFVQEMHKL